MFFSGWKEHGNRGEYGLLSGNGFLDLAMRGRNIADVTERRRCSRECDE